MATGEPAMLTQRIGVSIRTLEEWRRSWRRAEAEDRPELRMGPKFFKLGNRVWYEATDVEEFLAASKSRSGSRKKC